MATDIEITVPGQPMVKTRVLSMTRQLTASIATLNLIRRSAINQVIGYQPMQLSVNGSIVTGREQYTAPIDWMNAVEELFKSPERAALAGVVTGDAVLRSWKLDSDVLMFRHVWYARVTMAMDLDEPWISPSPVGQPPATPPPSWGILIGSGGRVPVPMSQISVNNANNIQVVDRLEAQANAKWMGHGSSGADISGVGHLDETTLFQWLMNGDIVTIDSEDFTGTDWLVAGVNIASEHFVDGAPTVNRFRIALT